MNEEGFIDTRTSFHCVILNVLLFPRVLSLLLFAVNQMTTTSFFCIFLSCDKIHDFCPEILYYSSVKLLLSVKIIPI